MAILVSLDALQVVIEEVAGIQRAPLGFGMELGGEDGPTLVYDTFVGRIVQVDEELFIRC